MVAREDFRLSNLAYFMYYLNDCYCYCSKYSLYSLLIFFHFHQPSRNVGPQLVDFDSFRTNLFCPIVYFYLNSFPNFLCHLAHHSSNFTRCYCYIGSYSNLYLPDIMSCFVYAFLISSLENLKFRDHGYLSWRV